jgi:osmoprotectant transport system ATP-binding protein
MIELQNVTKRYDNASVVDDVSFGIGRGEFCVLVGRSGSGKTSLLKMINRLLPITAGSIRFDGHDVMQMPAETLRRRIGYVIQSIGLFPHWTIAANIATVPSLLKWPRPKIADRVRELLTLLRLDAAIYADKYPHQLSGGEQQRVGIARALAADPDVLLMDEPFGALDPVTRPALRDELHRLQRDTAKTIIFVTHDMDEALVLADRIALLDHGRLTQIGTPTEILERPANDFVRDFIGRTDRGLKLLSVHRVGDRLRRGGSVAGEPIDPSLSLKDALSEMILRRTDQLPVRGPDGREGSISLDDLIA